VLVVVLMEVYDAYGAVRFALAGVTTPQVPISFRRRTRSALDARLGRLNTLRFHRRQRHWNKWHLIICVCVVQEVNLLSEYMVASMLVLMMATRLARSAGWSEPVDSNNIRIRAMAARVLRSYREPETLPILICDAILVTCLLRFQLLVSQLARKVRDGAPSQIIGVVYAELVRVVEKQILPTGSELTRLLITARV